MHMVQSDLGNLQAQNFQDQRPCRMRHQQTDRLEVIQAAHDPL